MNKLLIVVTMLLALLLLAMAVNCYHPNAAPTPSPKPQSTPSPFPSPTPQLAPTPPLTSASASTPAPAPSPTSAPLFLTILEPADESVVELSTITIRGKTLADAVVSVNGELTDVDSNGNFSLQVTLEEGPNVFDIIATDEDGNEVDAQLTVSFSP